MWAYGLHQIVSTKSNMLRSCFGARLASLSPCQLYSPLAPSPFPLSVSPLRARSRACPPVASVDVIVPASDGGDDDRGAGGGGEERTASSVARSSAHRLAEGKKVSAVSKQAATDAAVQKSVSGGERSERVVLNWDDEKT